MVKSRSVVVSKRKIDRASLSRKDTYTLQVRVLTREPGDGAFACDAGPLHHVSGRGGRRGKLYVVSEVGSNIVTFSSDAAKGD